MFTKLNNLNSKIQYAKYIIFLLYIFIIKSANATYLGTDGNCYYIIGSIQYAELYPGGHYAKSTNHWLFDEINRQGEDSTFVKKVHIAIPVAKVYSLIFTIDYENKWHLQGAGHVNHNYLVEDAQAIQAEWDETVSEIGDTSPSISPDMLRCDQENFIPSNTSSIPSSKNLGNPNHSEQCQ